MMYTLPQRLGSSRSLTLDVFTLVQLQGLVAYLAIERGDLEVALDFAHRAVHKAREEYAANPALTDRLSYYLRLEASVLESLGRLDEAMALDAECPN
jgi:hypothetical protein